MRWIERVGLLRGLDAGIIDHVLNTRISHAAGGKTLPILSRQMGRKPKSLTQSLRHVLFAMVGQVDPQIAIQQG